MAETYDRTRYVLLMRLPREVEVRIEDAFLALQGTTKPVMGYHVTVAGPFYLANDVTHDDLDVLTAWARGHDPLDIHVAGVDTFHTSDDNAVYLQVEPVEELRRIHMAVLELIGDRIMFQDERTRAWAYENYRPHVTLALGLTDREMEQISPAAATHNLAFDCTIHEIWLAKQGPNGPWQYIASYHLGADAPDEQAADPHHG